MSRPLKSPIRQNLVQILYYLKSGYGYEIAKIYTAIFPKVTQRSIYYQLRKGILTKEIIVQRVEEEKGNFSWGRSVEKVYYALGPLAQPQQSKRVEDYCQQWKTRSR